MTGGLPRKAAWLVGFVVVSGAAAVAARLAGAGDWDRGDLLALAVVSTATTITERFPLELRYRNERAVFSMSDALWTAGIFLVHPGVLVVGVAAGVLAGQALSGRSPLKLAFNAAQLPLALTAALLVFEAVGSPDIDEAAAWPAAAAAMAVFHTVNTVLVACIIAITERRPLHEVLLASTSLAHWVGNFSVGVIGAVLWSEAPAALPLLLVPIAVTALAYRGWLRTLQERDWMAGMGQTAGDIAASGDLTKRLTDVGEGEPVGRLAAALNSMLARIQLAVDREHAFIRESSHELRNPIAICRGHLEILPREPDPDDVRETVDVVIDELERMTRIVDDMGDLAYVDDPATLRHAPIAVDRLLAGVAAKAAPMLNGRLRTVAPGATSTVDADEQRLTQALINLVKNAYDHTPPEAAVELRAAPEPGAWRFEVADRGPGLDPESLPRIFEPFQKADASRGSGLGLAIVEGIARAHGGSAGVENRPGEGATFWVRIPR